MLKILLEIVVWAAVLGVVGWVMRRWYLASEDRKDLVWRWAISAVVLGFLAFLVGPMVGRGGYVGAFIGIPLTAVGGLVLAILWVGPLTGAAGSIISNIFDGGRTEAEREPLFSMVEARRKRGRYAEAADLMRQQLEEFPTHFRGQMVLAEILAIDLHDLDRAASVIEELVLQENHPPRNVAFALTQLADWHLKFARDVPEARACFERILARFPGTAEAHKAEQRLARLAGTETLLARPAVRLEPPVADPHLGVRAQPVPRPVTGPDPDEQLTALIAQLETFPHDNQAREELAMLYAGPFQRPDLAIQQLEQLIDQPHAPEGHVA
ncbi:MAG: tetratricopeptide repeat protein, partial [Verrucomicrobiae bacterium]|nr:tetratricopeptide repeat protein [Verrucomicrobiae bacterium]